MRLDEVANTDPDPDKLVGLVQFLAGRAQDQSARKQISQDAFIKLAQQLGINITPSNLQTMVEQPPLSNLLEPVQPNSQVITFKGGEPTDVSMPVNRAQDIVASMAKRANPLS